ncbi:MAG: hypothetical protein E7554_09150 [Ruminococcaceae bacterium]|nr:hypothetical protein [Oscillospiraceae bacterium]
MHRTRKIITTLRAAGLDAFHVGSHEGICRSPYCVVQPLSGALLSPAGGYMRYRILLYVPAHQPELLDTLARSVREALSGAEAEGWLTLSLPGGSIDVDDTFRAACGFTEYVSYYSQR